MKIEDDFLEEQEFVPLQKVLMSGQIAWFYMDMIDSGEDIDKFQFIHNLYFNYAPTSEFLKTVEPILRKLNPISIGKIKANLLTRTPNIIENSFHVDTLFSEEKMKQLTTSIFYVNTNNGYTKFEDGTKVESVANRMVTFPANMKHTGTSCTNERTRVVINFNYFN